MKRINVTFLALSFLVMSCSPLLQEPIAPEAFLPEENMPLTRSGESSQPVDYSAVTHFFQTDHRMILVHHVEFRDSVYVQTLTSDDMISLNITDDEQEFSNQYVISLNELLKNQ